MPFDSTRRRLLKLIPLGAVGSFIAACAGQPAASPTAAAAATATPAATPRPAVTQQPSVTFKWQSTFGTKDFFHQELIDLSK